ncbi:MAG: fumarate hydratase [Oscillospiraceae bacterium]
MRELEVSLVRDKVKELFIEASYVIGQDVYDSLCESKKTEKSTVGQSVLDQLIRNYDIAREERMPVCQDTGYAVVFAEIGQELVLKGGDITEAINEGVRLAYAEGFLRKSVVAEPIFNRKNTGDNTPAIIHYNIVPGDKLDIKVTAKGFGSENMSAIKMLVPADGLDGVKKFILETVKKAGPNPCPPIIVGVGVGGTMEKAAIMSKKALLRQVGEHNADSNYAQLERDLIKDINKLGIGPAGIGGNTTALAINIDYYPTHIAGLPVAVNICCHAARHGHAVL